MPVISVNALLASLVVRGLWKHISVIAPRRCSLQGEWPPHPKLLPRATVAPPLDVNDPAELRQLADTIGDWAQGLLQSVAHDADEGSQERQRLQLTIIVARLESPAKTWEHVDSRSLGLKYYVARLLHAWRLSCFAQHSIALKQVILASFSECSCCEFSAYIRACTPHV